MSDTPKRKPDDIELEPAEDDEEQADWNVDEPGEEEEDEGPESDRD